MNGITEHEAERMIDNVHDEIINGMNEGWLSPLEVEDYFSDMLGIEPDDLLEMF